MNLTERKMVDLLKTVRDSGAVSVKAEFEAEGTRMDELLRLVDMARAANLKLTVKIGGCEAIRDLLEAKQIGVDYIVAPMVETPYALSKFVGAVALTFNGAEREDTQFLFNVETITTFENIDSMLEIAKNGKLNGAVFGRVDFSGSLGLSRDAIESDQLTNYVMETSKKVRDLKLDLVVGGAVSVDAIQNLRLVYESYLTRFETRKIVFNASSLENDELRSALLAAVHFELLWLQNKRDYYAHITSEDQKRIEMLENRWNVLNR